MLRQSISPDYQMNCDVEGFDEMLLEGDNVTFFLIRYHGSIWKCYFKAIVVMLLCEVYGQLAYAPFTKIALDAVIYRQQL